MKYFLFFLAIAIIDVQAKPITDQDLLQRGNLQTLRENATSYQYYYINIHNEKYAIGVYQKHPIGNIRYLILHDSEDASFDSGLEAIKNGGLMVVLENNEQRHLFEQTKNKSTNIDPNRIFTPNNKYFALGQTILQYLQLTPQSTIISLHNNSPSSGFGMKNIKKYGATDIICQNDKEQKNLYWLPYNTDNQKSIKSLANTLCNYQNFNVVLENAPSITQGDGSLSIYASNKGYQYVNIEIKAGIKNSATSERMAKDNQTRYINKLLSSINN